MYSKKTYYTTATLLAAMLPQGTSSVRIHSLEQRSQSYDPTLITLDQRTNDVYYNTFGSGLAQAADDKKAVQSVDKKEGKSDDKKNDKDD